MMHVKPIQEQGNTLPLGRQSGSMKLDIHVGTLKQNLFWFYLKAQKLGGTNLEPGMLLPEMFWYLDGNLATLYMKIHKNLGLFHRK